MLKRIVLSYYKWRIERMMERYAQKYSIVELDNIMFQLGYVRTVKNNKVTYVYKFKDVQ